MHLAQAFLAANLLPWPLGYQKQNRYFATQQQAWAMPLKLDSSKSHHFIKNIDVK
jgi:hypothetical protein